MVCIISSSGDPNTNRIIDWLYHFKCDFIRADLAKEDYNNIRIKLDGTTNVSLILNNGQTIDFAEVSCFLYRGSYFRYNIDDIDWPSHLPELPVRNHLRQEYNSLTHFFYSEMAKNSVGLPAPQPLNKLWQLSAAQSVGLKVPKTLVSSAKADIGEFYEGGGAINKAIQEVFVCQEPGKFYYGRTEEVHLPEMDEEFFPALFQEYIGKVCEIRSFYLDGSVYSISMKHASEEKSIDYRDHYHSMEYAPYQLPSSVEDKIRSMMQQLNLISGSIDLILQDNGDFVFIEVNPQGQYDWVSQYGNYGLHKKIAQFLYNKELKFIRNGSKEKKGFNLNQNKGQ